VSLDGTADSAPHDPTANSRTLGEMVLALQQQHAASGDEVAIDVVAALMRILQIAEAPTPKETMLTPEAMAEFLSVSRTTIHAMNVDGKLPEPYSFGGPKWFRTDVLAWIACGALPRSQWNKKKERVLLAILRSPM
jgi:predicted DNA-binding transcriptional regulator AlpA